MVDPMAFGYGDLTFSWGDHICTIFENREQQMSVMIPFIAQGIRAQQRCIWASQPQSADLFRRRLRETGADLPTLEASGQLLILSGMEHYLSDGLFEPEKTIELTMALYQDSIRQGYRGIRATGDASWISDHPVDLELWEEYEREFGLQIAGKPVVTVCQYDARRFSGQFLIAALQTHPIVILGETVRRNPFYAAPEDLTSRPKVH